MNKHKTTGYFTQAEFEAMQAGSARDVARYKRLAEARSKKDHAARNKI